MTKIVINTKAGGFSISQEAAEIIASLKKVSTIDRRNIERDDSDLVEVVERLGKESWGTSAKLKIVEIPDDVEWDVYEVYGIEWIAEKHRTWE